MAPTIQGTSTEFYRVDRTLAPGLAGSFHAELVNHGGHYYAHLATDPDAERGVGSKKAGGRNGDVVVEGVSHEGWKRISKAFDAIDSDNPTRLQVSNAILHLPFITWDRPYSGR